MVAEGWELVHSEVWEEDWLKFELQLTVNHEQELYIDGYWHIPSEALANYLIWSDFWDDDNLPPEHLGFDSFGEKFHYIQDTPQPKNY